MVKQNCTLYSMYQKKSPHDLNIASYFEVVTSKYSKGRKYLAEVTIAILNYFEKNIKLVQVRVLRYFRFFMCVHEARPKLLDKEKRKVADGRGAISCSSEKKGIFLVRVCEVTITYSFHPRGS